MQLTTVFGSEKIRDAVKKVGASVAALSLAACASAPKEDELPAVNTVEAWKQAQEQVIAKAEESKVRTVREAASAAQRIAEGERKSFLFDRIVAAATLEIQDGEAGIYTLMMNGFMASEDDQVKLTLETALQDMGIKKGVIDRLSHAKYVRNAAAALPGVQATCVLNEYGEKTFSMDIAESPYGPWKEQMVSDPRYAFEKGVTGADIYVVSYDGDGASSVSAANTTPDYAPYFPQVNGEEAQKSSCTSAQTAAPEPNQP